MKTNFPNVFAELVGKNIETLTAKEWAKALNKKSPATIHNWQQEDAKVPDNIIAMSKLILALDEPKQAVAHIKNNQSAAAWLSAAEAILILSQSTVVGALWGSAVGAATAFESDAVKDVIQRLKEK